MDIDDRMSVYSDSTGSSMTGTTAPSLYSYSSSRDGNALLRSVEGRLFNSQNDLYFLPADDGEFSRLDKQHLMLYMAVGGLYVPTEDVRRILAPEPGIEKSILDLGAGGGNWAIGMANEFPHAEIVGIDLAPSTARSPPPNCRFEFDDFTLGLPHYYDKFDVVHARSTSNGVPDFEAFISEAAKCLKPGGILLMTESDFIVDDYRKRPQEQAYGTGSPGQSWMSRMWFEASSTMRRRGSAVFAGHTLYDMVSRCPEIIDVHRSDYWLPVGPWERGSTPDDNRRLEIIGTLMRQNVCEFVRSLKPLFVSAGYPPAFIEQCINGTDRETTDLSVHMYVKWHYAWGKRAPTDGDAAEAAMDVEPVGTRPLTRLEFEGEPEQLGLGPHPNYFVRSAMPPER